MKPLVVLVSSFFIALGLTAALKGVDLIFSGKIAMAVMLLFTSLGHFRFGKGMELMIPAGIPFKRMLVWITGIMEIGASIGILVPSLSRDTGLFLLVFFILLFPANVHAAFSRVNFEKADHSGKGPGYLWFRVPLQLFLMAWVYFFVVRQSF